MGLSIMYIDTGKKKSVLDKVTWMKNSYRERTACEPKVIFLHPDHLQGETKTVPMTLHELLGLTVLSAGKMLSVNSFVLCEEPSDYLAEKASPLPTR